METESNTNTNVAPVVTGTVTFVFSDLEGSTRLLNALRDEYGQLLDDYYELVGGAFERNGGVGARPSRRWPVPQLPERAPRGRGRGRGTARDGRPRLAGRRESYAHGWALHTGEPISARTRYFGMDVHRAARIAAAGHGGQILLSQTTRDLVSSDLPADTVACRPGPALAEGPGRARAPLPARVEGLAARLPAAASR